MDVHAKMSVTEFIKYHFRHFNALVIVDAAEAYRRHLDQGGKMLLAMAGAMSPAELGLSLAEMIRQEKVHAICTTGANLEEDIFNLVAHNHYRRVPNYRNLTEDEELALRERGLNRVTDTCIPEEEAMRRIERQVLKYWQQAERDGQRYSTTNTCISSSATAISANFSKLIRKIRGCTRLAKKICRFSLRVGKIPRS